MPRLLMNKGNQHDRRKTWCSVIQGQKYFSSVDIIEEKIPVLALFRLQRK